MNVVVNLHSQDVPVGCIPVIVMDCWEHSYYSDFFNHRKDYVFAMMRELRWEKIEERFEQTEMVAKVLR
jgi:Fe-Mn family superoxide dismutase